MPELGKKYTCYSCHTKFYDLGKAEPLCPKCGADQRDADEAPVVTPTRSRRVAAAAAPAPVEEPIEDNEFGGEGEAAPATGDEEDEEIVADGREEEEEEEEDEEY
ncbi:MAG TPA: FYDLN acid domain-containing protein [Thermoanaerobaculia bacterium]